MSRTLHIPGASICLDMTYPENVLKDETSLRMRTDYPKLRAESVLEAHLQSAGLARGLFPFRLGTSVVNPDQGPAQASSSAQVLRVVSGRALVFPQPRGDSHTRDGGKNKKGSEHNSQGREQRLVTPRHGRAFPWVLGPHFLSLNFFSLDIPVHVIFVRLNVGLKNKAGLN